MAYTYAGQYGPVEALSPLGVLLKSTVFTVYSPPGQTSTLATLYTDRSKGTVAGNPGMTSGNGNLTFFADPGRYDVLVNNITLTVEVWPDPADLVAGVPLTSVKADGVTDDAPAIRAAIAALPVNGASYTPVGGGKLILPPGIIRLGSGVNAGQGAAAINLLANVWLDGQGDSTVLLVDGAFDGIAATGLDSFGLSGWRISNLVLVATVAGAGQTAIATHAFGSQSGGHTQCIIDAVQITNETSLGRYSKFTRGLFGDFLTESEVRGIDVEGVTGKGIVLTNSSNALVFLAPRVRVNSIGWQVGGSSSPFILGGTTEGNTVSGLQSTNSSVQAFGHHFEQTGSVPDVIIDGGGTNAILGGESSIIVIGPRAAVGDAVTNGTATVTSASAAFVASDVGRPVTGTNIPSNTFIGVVNSATSIGLSASSIANTPVNASGSGSGGQLTVGSAASDTEIGNAHLARTSITIGAGCLGTCIGKVECPSIIENGTNTVTLAWRQVGLQPQYTTLRQVFVQRLQRNVYGAQGSSGQNVNFDASQGDINTITLAFNVPSSSIANPTSGQELTIEFIQDATGGRTYAWPANCRFAGGAAPAATTTANRKDSVTFRYDSGPALWMEVARAIGVPVT